MKLGAATRNHEARGSNPLRLLVNHLIEYAAEPTSAGDGASGTHRHPHGGRVSRVTSGQSIGAFCMQHGPAPGTPWARGAMLWRIRPRAGALMGYARRLANIDPNFNSSQAMKTFSKSSEPINIAAESATSSGARLPS
jgi:acetolactate synthase-1/2/3 large subunit